MAKTVSKPEASIEKKMCESKPAERSSRGRYALSELICSRIQIAAIGKITTKKLSTGLRILLKSIIVTTAKAVTESIV